MDDPSLTVEEYFKLEEEKGHKHGKVFNWQTATYGKIRVDDDFHDFSSVETEFPTIVINNDFATRNVLPCKSQVSEIVNDEIDFRKSFDESDDEDCAVIYDANSFSYKMISVNDLKTDLKNDYEKVMPSIPLPEPAISCFDDLDFFDDFENKFQAIVYNDAQKSNMAPLLPREQRYLFLRYEGLEYTNADITDFESRLERIHIREVHRVPVFDFKGLSNLMAAGLTATLTIEHHDQASMSVFTSHAWRRMFGQAIVELDTPGTLQFQLGGARRRMSWREFILALGLHTEEEMQTPGFGAYWAESARQIPDRGDLSDYWRGILSTGDFLGTIPSYILLRDPILRLCHRLIACSITGRSLAPEKVTMTDLFYLRGMDVGSVNVPYLLARYLRMFAAGRKIGVHISGGQFVSRLADHLGLLTAEILGGLTIIATELLRIDMAELV
ncbi:hypothetical protein Tco_0612844 [Tanacetum coccineum]